MALKYKIMPIPIWTFFQSDGELAVGGKVYFKRADAPAEDKTVYADAAGTIPYANPIILNGIGSIPQLIYFADDEDYYLEAQDSLGNVITTITRFPTKDEVEGDTEADPYQNYALNSDFKLYFSNIISPIPTTAPIDVAPFLQFAKSNLNATDSIKVIPFDLGQTEVYGNPHAYIEYACTSIGAGGETDKSFSLDLGDGVEFLSNQTITVSICGKSPTASIIKLFYRQYFGLGGSTEVDDEIDSISLNNQWNKYSKTYKVPDVSGKTIGAGNRTFIKIQLELNAIAIIDFSCLQINIGEKQIAYKVRGYFEDYIYETGSKLPIPNSNPVLDLGKSLTIDKRLSVAGRELYTQENQFTYSLAHNPPIGASMYWFGETSTVPNGYLALIGTALPKGRFPFYNLYSIIGDKYTTTAHKRLVATVLTDTLTVTATNNGAITAPADNNTGFTITTIDPGTPTTPQQFTIKCLAASSIPNNSYFTCHNIIDGAGVTYRVYIVKNGNADIPTQPANSYALMCYILDGDDADTVAARLADQIFQPFVYNLPDTRGQFVRVVDGGAGRDPDRASRSARPDGVTGDNVGTEQGWQIQSHKHPYTRRPIGGTADGANSNYSQGSDASTTTSPEGGNQTNPINIGAYLIMRAY